MPLRTSVCIVGGGPAGMMLGLLLARQGLSTVVLEQHGDFLRDFRGDTVHPSTLDVLDDLGLGAAVARAEHRDVTELRMTFGDGSYRLADFSRLRVRHPYVRFMPQWDFLDVLAGAAEQLATFTLLRRHRAVDLRWRGGLVDGVRADSPSGPVEVQAELTIAADGRGSLVRARAGLIPREFGAPMDVLWFRLPRAPNAPAGLDIHIGRGQMLLAIDRGAYWQIAYVIRKGGDDRIRAAGIEELRRAVGGLVPALRPSVHHLRALTDVHTLTVRVDRLRRWHRPGLLCIGDAAHAMSPIGGVGINLAIQDAVCAARILAEPLRAGRLDSSVLARVQARRAFPTVGTQLLQRAGQRFLVGPVLAGTRPSIAPPPIRLVGRVPALQAAAARMIGVGLRPERLPESR